MTTTSSRPDFAAAPPGMRSTLISVLRRCYQHDSPRTLRTRAATLREVTAAYRDADLAAIGVGELEKLADALEAGAS